MNDPESDSLDPSPEPAINPTGCPELVETPVQPPAFVPNTSLLIAAIAIHLVALFAMKVIPGSPFEMVLIPTVIAGISMLAIWLAMGFKPMGLPIAVTAIYCLVLLWGMDDPWEWMFAVSLIGMQMVCVAVPVRFLATLGLMIAPLGSVVESPGALRFTIRHLIVWTSVAACLLAGGRYVFDFMADVRRSNDFATGWSVAAASLGLIAFLGIWTVLGKKHPAPRLLVSLACMLLLSLAIAHIEPLASDIEFTLGMFSLHTIVLWTTLWTVRLAGFRLLRTKEVRHFSLPRYRWGMDSADPKLDAKPVPLRWGWALASIATPFVGFPGGFFGGMMAMSLLPRSVLNQGPWGGGHPMDIIFWSGLCWGIFCCFGLYVARIAHRRNELRWLVALGYVLNGIIVIWTLGVVLERVFNRLL